LINVGIHVYRYNVTLDSYRFYQFLQLQSIEHLGSLGIDMSCSGFTLDTLTLVTRDRIAFNSTDSHSAVVIYKFNTTSQYFEISTNIQETENNNGVPITYKNETWFGVGNGVAFDSESQQWILPVSSPRSSLGIDIYTQSPNQAWRKSFVIQNNNPLRSFFGGTLKLSKDGRFLLVSDATGTDGRGSVFLYNLRKANQQVLGFETIYRPNNQGLSFDLIGRFSKQGDRDYQNKTKPNFFADHFGKSIDMNDWIAVIGSPVEDCVYSFVVPPICNKMLMNRFIQCDLYAG
jgi:hypothetical protein